MNIFGKRIKTVLLSLILLICFYVSGCGQESKKTEVLVLAAASLTDVCDEIEALYEKEHPNIDLSFSFGGSGALQTQIEEGAPCDVFFSASMKQMNALQEKELMQNDSIARLLENKIVMIVPANSSSDIASFEDFASDKIKMIGLGEPGSVPAGQYAEEVFTTLGILDAVKAKANYGQNVRTVLSWVEESAVDCGVVYATDAFATDKVKIICEAPSGSCKQVIYPVGIVRATKHENEAKTFVQFLSSDDAMALFSKYGFSPVN